MLTEHEQHPADLTVQQQQDILNHTYELLTEFNHGIPPKVCIKCNFPEHGLKISKGSTAPAWDTSKEGTNLLLEKGIQYGANFLQLPQP